MTICNTLNRTEPGVLASTDEGDDFHLRLAVGVGKVSEQCRSLGTYLRTCPNRNTIFSEIQWFHTHVYN